MGTNYYFRKKVLDIPRLDAIVDSLNNEYDALLEKYNEKMREAIKEMGLEDDYFEFERQDSFASLFSHESYGDIHVGKVSYGWKPHMQACEQFKSIPELKQWYAENKNEYQFIDEYGDDVVFEEYLEEITEHNNDKENQRHSSEQSSDGFDWCYARFS